MDRIGRYRLVRRLGAGSFATVWLACDDTLDAEVAVKVLAENWALNDDVRNRFLAESRIMRRIQDRRIVSVHDIGELPDGRPYFVMDYCDAGSLSDIRRNPGSPGLTLRLCAEACRALAVLHRHHVVHRDVTPGNLLLDSRPDGSVQVRLADLGVAKELIGQQGMTMTAGTPAYMAPEQATGHHLDHRADIYAMACVTYAVLTGRPPFPVHAVQDLLTRRPDAQPVPVAARIGAPAELDTLLQAALSPDPVRRPQTAEAMAVALDRIADIMQSGRPAPFRPERHRQPERHSPFAPPWGHPTVHGYSPGHSQPAVHAHASLPGASAPAWRFWLLTGLAAVFAFFGALFLTLTLVG